ncbi:hypothetical protein K458DRAFT_404734 [Lentithecium fluviatile CBS 122367]|uniref:Uncharacterized protein n=1 Tax=Lentithecium fluviatile CBS 122367 TaxID=1168545 RepID=A0A6G1J0X5_9PLEO|nr:hypothetical protein K458DRAFT_404734 [Lentithecium fluviatile CBS 122367]
MTVGPTFTNEGEPGLRGGLPNHEEVVTSLLATAPEQSPNQGNMTQGTQSLHEFTKALRFDDRNLVSKLAIISAYIILTNNNRCAFEDPAISKIVEKAQMIATSKILAHATNFGGVPLQSFLNQITFDEFERAQYVHVAKVFQTTYVAPKDYNGEMLWQGIWRHKTL